MLQQQRTAARLVSIATRVVGRRQVVRAARFALNQARLDIPNSPLGNGEYSLQRWMLSAFTDARPMTVFDVGANCGDWSQSMLDHATTAGRRIGLHAFEPTTFSHQLLSARLKERAAVHQLALSDSVGTTTLHIVEQGAGTNSIYPTTSGRHPYAQAESIATTTIDEYSHRNRIDNIDLLKVDTEGHDLFVLRGATRLLAARRISAIQFEYNHRWILARSFLKDVFDLAQPWGYRIGKLTPRGMEEYPAWDPDLETFVEGNYLLATPELVPKLPRVIWWKERTGSTRRHHR